MNFTSNPSLSEESKKAKPPILLAAGQNLKLRPKEGQNQKNLINYIDQQLSQDQHVFPILTSKNSNQLPFFDEPSPTRINRNQLKPTSLVIQSVRNPQTKNIAVEKFKTIKSNDSNLGIRYVDNQVFPFENTQLPILKGQGFINGDTLNSGEFQSRDGFYLRKNTPDGVGDDDMDFEQENSNLLDQSQLDRYVKMPNVNADQADLQKEIGQKLVFKDNINVHDDILLQRNDSFYKVIDKDSIEIIDAYRDRCPCLNFRKSIMKTRIYINRLAILIITHRVFESISVFVIVMNSIFLALVDPLASSEPDYQQKADVVFQILYTIEMVFKIVAKGFIFNKGAYMRDAWNLLDITIVTTGYIGYIQAGKGTNLQSLRSFRVIRPLRTISSVEGLRIIVSSLATAMPMLLDALIVLLFFHFVFGIAGLQLFAGTFKQTCIYLETGLPNPGDLTCGGNFICPPGQICGKGIQNPASSNQANNYDNIGYSLIQVFQTISLEGWTWTMMLNEMAAGQWTIIYYLLQVVIGAWFCLQLFGTIIQDKFSEAHENKLQSKNTAKKVVNKRLGADDTIDDEIPDEKDLDKIIAAAGEKADPLYLIEENENLTAEEKRTMKDRLRIQTLIKKYELAIKHRQIREKINPKDQQSMISATTSYAQGQMKKYASVESRKYVSEQDHNPNIENLISELQSMGSMHEDNGSYYNDKTIERNQEVDQDSNNLSIILDDTIKKHPQNMKMHGIVDLKSQKHATQRANNIKEQVGFIIQDKDNSKNGSHQNHGIYGIKSLRMKNANKEMQDLYTKIGKDFDIFRFLENEGDDELSIDDLSSNEFGIANYKEDISAAEEGANNTSAEKKFEKKQTQVSQFRRKNSEREENPNETHLITEPQNQPQQLQESAPRYGFIPSPSRKPKIAKNQGRRKTVVGSTKNVSDYEQVAIADDEHDKKGDSPDKTQQPPSFKQKFISFFSKKKPSVEERSQKQIDELKSMRMSQLNMTNDGIRDETKRSKSSHWNAAKEKEEQIKYAKNMIAPTKDIPDVANASIKVRARSEARKKEIINKEVNLFKIRNELMKEKRNHFFSEAVKNMEKSKIELKKEETERALKKRLIVLGSGFQHPTTPMSPNSKKRLLNRSGTFQVNSNSQAALDERGSLQVSNDSADIKKKLKQNDIDPFIDSECEREVKQIKEEIQVQDEKVIQEIDVEEEMLKKKKKIGLKLKNYNFPSVNDVFENRTTKQMEKVNLYGYNKHTIPKPPLLTADERKKIAYDKKRLNKRNYVPTQKKLWYGQRKLFKELLYEEKLDSDDNQENILQRVEEKYNFDHKSNIHVTGTLSLVTAKPNHESKMMNKNYYLEDKIKIIQSQQFSRQGSLSDQIVNQSRDEFKLGSQREIEERDIVEVNKESVIQELSNSQHSIMQGELRVGDYGSNSNNMMVKSAQTNSRTRLIQAQTIQRGKTASSDSPRKPGHNSGEGSVSNSKALLSKINKIAPSSVKTNKTEIRLTSRPEALTDKQILKRLNHDVKNSNVFQKFNILNFPQKIQKVQGLTDKQATKKEQRQKKRNKDKKQLQMAAANDDAADSDTSQEGDLETDYFIDLQADQAAQVLKAKQIALNKPKDTLEWSGQDVIMRLDPYKARDAIQKLNAIRIWPKGIKGILTRWRVFLKRCVQHGLIENLMTFLVFFNTIILALDRTTITPVETYIYNELNTFFTITFAIEMGIKIIGIGIVKFLKDPMNYMDGTIVILSLVELIFLSGKGALSAFRSVRMLRTFRVLRVARLLRGLKSMRNIINVVTRSISSFMYLGILLFLFVFIYALLGMQLFGGKFIFLAQPRYSFDSFSESFMVVFDLLSGENWNNSFFNAMYSSVNHYLTCLYFITNMLIGNTALLQLFLAIVLDSFTAVDEEEHDTSEKRAAKLKKNKMEIQEKEGDDLVYGIEEIDLELMNADQKIQKKKGKRKAKKKKVVNYLLDESIEIDNEELEKEKIHMAGPIELFPDCDCNLAIFLFKKVKAYLQSLQDNRFRILCYKIAQHKLFDGFIMATIAGSTIKLVIDTYPQTPAATAISNQFDLVFLLIFTVEALTKIFSYGFVMCDGSYLRESWSKLDFFIVVVSWADELITSISIPVIKIFRILRPLRFISHNKNMKFIVGALLSSLGGIANVGIVVIAVFLMYSILGVNLFGGKLFFCNINSYELENQLICYKQRGDWSSYYQNMDNVYSAFLTLCGVSTFEGWPDVAYSFGDMVDVDIGPKPNYSFSNVYYYVSFVFLVTMFLMNLFVGVLFMNFESVQRDEKEKFLLDENDLNWIDMMRMIVNTKPEIIKTPNNRFSKFLVKNIGNDSKFDKFVQIMIILNMIVMCMAYDDMTPLYENATEKANWFFSFFFLGEAILKLTAQGLSYFRNGNNKFDFTIVVTSLLDIGVSQINTNTLLKVGISQQDVKLLKILRIGRIIRLLNKIKSLQAMMQTIFFALGPLINVFALVMLTFFIYAILGVFIVSGVTTGSRINDYFNFWNFGMAFIILFRNCTGEDWPSVTRDIYLFPPNCLPGLTCGSMFGSLYYLSFQLMTYFIMVNLFVLIIIQQFDMYYFNSQNVLERFRKDLVLFKLAWSEFSIQHHGIKISSDSLTFFFKKLEGDIGMKNETEKTILKLTTKMSIQGDEEGYVYFNELLFKTMKRVYGSERTNKKMLRDSEISTLLKLEKIKKSQSKEARKNERLQALQVNPFLLVMYRNMSFKAWRKVYKQNFELREHQKENLIERDSSDDDESARTNQDFYYEQVDDYVIDQNDYEYQEYLRKQLFDSKSRMSQDDIQSSLRNEDVPAISVMDQQEMNDQIGRDTVLSADGMRQTQQVAHGQQFQISLQKTESMGNMRTNSLQD